MASGDETSNVVRDWFKRFIESSGVRVVKDDIKPVRRGELGDAGAHLSATHDPDALDLHHVSALVSFTTTNVTFNNEGKKGADNNKEKLMQNNTCHRVATQPI